MQKASLKNVLYKATVSKQVGACSVMVIEEVPVL